LKQVALHSHESEVGELLTIGWQLLPYGKPPSGRLQRAKPPSGLVCQSLAEGNSKVRFIVRAAIGGNLCKRLLSSHSARLTATHYLLL